MNTVIRCTVLSLFFLILPIYVSFAQVVVPDAKPIFKSAIQSDVQLAAIQKKIAAITDKTTLEETLKQRILAAYYAAEANAEESLILEQESQMIQNQL
ncbi:MAG: hypothetical protein K0U40_00430, partial [Betaproteobacteria bacterium]|nr:hypothetical protein [Betaproteobacteria bacterium]